LRNRVFQSLARIAESHIVIAPSKHQVIINPQSGRRERVHVNLEAVYPTPEEPGTELSFEELWAANRGWLDADWDDKSLLDSQHEVNDENSPPVELVTRAVERKLVIYKEVVALDENGALKDYPRPTKGRKKKLEVNETQVSTYTCFFHTLMFILRPHLILYLSFGLLVTNPPCLTSQSKPRLSVRAKNQEEKRCIIRAHHDDAHQGCNG
jgi:hypothetical protein